MRFLAPSGLGMTNNIINIVARLNGISSFVDAVKPRHIVNKTKLSFRAKRGTFLFLR